MNQTGTYIFNLYHYMINVRDTLEYTIPREHTLETYNARKKVLESAFDERSPLGNFLKNNPEQAEKINATIHDFIDTIYGEESNILKVSGDKLNVDHTQHIVIFEKTIGVCETIRDIIYGYLNYAKQQKQEEPSLNQLLEKDDRFYRILSTSLMISEFQHSFNEFQKVMAESKGQPSPQSNFIVQNEILKLSGLIRFVYAHHKVTDNDTLDTLREADELIEMTEGRRDRRNDASFKDLFEKVTKNFQEHIAKLEAEWKGDLNKVFEEVRASMPTAQA